MSLAVLCFLLLAIFADAKDAELKEYVIDLDSRAEDHWKHVALDYQENIALEAGFMAQLDPAMFRMLSIMASGMLEEIPQPYHDELIGLAKYANLTIGEAVVYNMLYELTAYGRATGNSSHRACTSIVATLSNGHVIHGRNLDYSRIPKLNRIAINVDFQRNGKTVYRGTTFAGYIGLSTGYKPGGFTISLDERNQGNWMLNDNQSAKLGPNGIAAFKIRDLFADDSSNFQTAVKTLASTELIAPCYIIVGGVKGNEGVVITHNRTGPINMWNLNDTANVWFLVETNYDHWVAPPTEDDRRDPAIKMLSFMGQQNLTSDSLYTVLSTSPILNNGTMYTTLMSAGDGLYEAWARNL